jgi:hypothetical protein
MKVHRNGMIHCYVGALGSTKKGVQEIREFLDKSETFFAIASVSGEDNKISRVIFDDESHAELFLLRFSGRD